MLEKVDITTSDEYLEALLKQVQINSAPDCAGKVEFEEFVHFVIQDRYHKK